MDSIQKLIDNDLLKEQEQEKTREKSGLWTPSRFGRCYRFQYWSRKKEPETDFADIKKLRRWKVGKIYHKYVQGFFPKEICEVKIVKDDIIGYADLVLEDRVIDIKSVDDYEFKYLLAPNYNIEKEKETNCMQVCTYAWLLEKPTACLWFINTRSSISLEFDIKVVHFIPKIEQELQILRAYWDKDKLPPPCPRTYGGKECNYCAYLTKCQGKEDSNCYHNPNKTA